MNWYVYPPTDNRLYFVDDTVPDNEYTVDIDDQDTLNYMYDDIGNLIKDVQGSIDTILWTVYGKVKHVIMADTSQKPDLEFFYSPGGQRITKLVYYTHNPIQINDSVVAVYYVRDASGNIMATYSRTKYYVTVNPPSINYSHLRLTEQYLYGSARLGYRKPNIDLMDSPVIPPEKQNVIYTWRGYKRYALTNHLGNVLSVVSDRRTGVCGTDTSASGDTLVAFYNADIISAQDYYPFGMQQPGRKFSSSGYRFGFGGQEMDNEIYGEGNSYTAQFWQYDPRLGRRWNFDPVVKEWQSGYVTFSNSPIFFNDPNGDCEDCPKAKDGETNEELGTYNAETDTWNGGALDKVSVTGESTSNETENCCPVLTGIGKAVANTAVDLVGFGWEQIANATGSLITGDENFELLPRFDVKKDELVSYAASMLILAVIEPTPAGEVNLAAKSVKTATGLVDDVAKQAKSWLGKDYKVIINKAGDKIFMSKDKLRKMRFDVKNPRGDAPHMHLEKFKNGKWVDVIPGKHRIYPKP